MSSNNYDTEDPYRNYHERRFVVTKSRDRFGSSSSTRRAFSNVAQYNYGDAPLDNTKSVPPKLEVSRDTGLPPSSSASSNQFKQTNSRSRNGRNYPESNSGYGGIAGVSSHPNDARKNQKLASPYRQNAREQKTHSRVYDAPPYSPNQSISEKKSLLQQQHSDTFYTNLDQSPRGGYNGYDDAINGNVGPSNDDVRNQINMFSRIALGFDPDDSHELHNSFQSDDEYPSAFNICYNMYKEKRTKWFYDEETPEFSSLQQINWAIVIGILMGVFTAVWAVIVDMLIEVVWKKVPETLYKWGVFTDLFGPRPLPHYIWLCTAFFGGILSYITVSLPKPIPGQNEWIKSLHRKGVIEYDTAHYIFLIAVTGMASGLSLGPELPLVLTSGMAGSFFARKTRQSILSSRVMNLTAASAAIGGFFGFPMAGALFVLELPHRMGLQYFEALHPSIVASIASVITNRIVVKNDIKGYFNYPFLTTSLPSHIFYVAILYGFVGGFVGMFYTKGFLFFKTNVHDLFHAHDDHHQDDANHNSSAAEELPLNGSLKHLKVDKVGNGHSKEGPLVFHSLFSCHITNEKLRATIVGIIAGAVVGVIGMFLPALLFWGEEQLQSIIDNGITPLPVFGEGDEITADLTAYGYCLPSQSKYENISIGCSALLTVGKVITYGVSLGTGIVGGQFWGPLFVGANAANLFTSIMQKIYEKYDVGHVLCMYPCLALICMMGATHVVTFRASTAIMLILTLTISSFSPEGDDTGGDYSAIFPLLVISCYISLMMTRDTVCYKKQGCRGDLIVTRPTLCEPGKEGAPVVYSDDEHSESSSMSMSSYLLDKADSDDDSVDIVSKAKIVDTNVTNSDIEFNFKAISAANNSFLEYDQQPYNAPSPPPPPRPESRFPKHPSSDFGSMDSNLTSIEPKNGASMLPRKPTHRRIQSEDGRSKFKALTAVSEGRHRTRSNSLTRRMQSDGSVGGSSRASSRRNSLNRRRIDSFGEIGDDEMQPNVLDQARQRAASKSKDDSVPKNTIPKSHRRKASLGSNSVSSQVWTDPAGSVGQGDVERAFHSRYNQEYLGR